MTAVRVTLIFVVLFWMYGGYAWLTNQVPPVLPARRLLLILGMAAFLVSALAIPRAFDGGGVAFGLGYLLAVALATAVLGIYAAGAIQLVALVAVLLGMLVPEARWRRAVGA